MNISDDSYYNNVILAWDEASWEFQTACVEANKEYSLANKLGILHWDTIDMKNDQLTQITWAKDTIDGVWTKVQIYYNQFEHIFQELLAKEIDWESARMLAVELWFRMIMDLIAMNADDLRKGEIAIAATDIIDINHLAWERGKFFQDTMKEAMKKAIQTTQIAITAGETAILGTNPQAKYAQKIIEDLYKVLHEDINTDKNTLALVEKGLDKINAKLEGIEFNISWTALWLEVEEKKLVLLNGEYYDIIAFRENTTNGIIWPRANGVTKIREDMESIMGEWWENMTFEDFMDKIWLIKTKKIPENVFTICRGKKLWDIATGTTTVFNPFIANKLLWWLDGKPIAKIAKLIHVTGNPLKKISEWIGDKNYKVELNLGTTTVPQIITLLQVALDIPDEQAMNKRNMGVPYAIVAYPGDRPAIAKLAHEHGFKTSVIGSVQKKSPWKEDEKNTIMWVGLGNSSMTF